MESSLNYVENPPSWTYNLKHQEYNINESACIMTGYKSDEASAHLPLNFSKQPSFEKKRITLANGEIFSIMVFSRPIKGEGENIIGFCYQAVPYDNSVAKFTLKLRYLLHCQEEKIASLMALQY